jgi:serine protease Do
MSGEPGDRAVRFAADWERLAEGLRAVLVTVRSPAGGGSGTAWTQDGVVVTNSHVVRGDRPVVVTRDGREHQAALVAREAEADIAVLRIDAEFPDVAVPREGERVRIGELAFAIGNPWGQEGVLTRGIVVGRGPGGIENAVPLADAIRADVRLAPGNSGGPLADAAGRVIGVNSMITGGMAVAVPADLVDAVVHGRRAVLGITGRAIPLPPVIAASYGARDGRGLLLTEIAPGSSAERAGLRPGDVVLRIDGVEGGLGAVARRLRALRSGHTARFDVLREAGTFVAEVVPGDRAA